MRPSHRARLTMYCRLVMHQHTLASILDPVRHANEIRFTFSSSHVRMETSVAQSAKGVQ